MPDSLSPASPATVRRRRLGLSLRVLMLLVVILGGGMGWWAYRARVQREAVAEIVAAGGKVYYDWEWDDDKPSPPTAKPRRPIWLVDRLGPDYLGNVVAVCFYSSDANKANDEALIPVSRLPYLRHLDLDDDDLAAAAGDEFSAGWSKITDRGLSHIRKLGRLENLSLSSTDVDGPGLAQLTGMASLRRLNLRLIPLTDNDARCLARFTRLESLRLDSKELTDAALENIVGLTSLTYLELCCPQITSEGLKCLAGLTRLEKLFIASSRLTSLEPLVQLDRLSTLAINFAFRGTMERCRISDGSARKIGRLTSLRDLRLDGCDIPDEDFDFLSGLTELTDLELCGTTIGDRGLAGLARLTHLERLDLTASVITDSGISHISRLHTIKQLYLTSTRISDAGVPKLYGLGACSFIELSNTAVSLEGLRMLQQQIPKTEIHHPAMPILIRTRAMLGPGSLDGDGPSEP
jgi:hypothetical protein